MSLLALLIALAMPAILARRLAVRLQCWIATFLAAAIIPGLLGVWGSIERAGISPTNVLITAGSPFARSEQWVYLLGGSAFLFAFGLVAAWLSIALKRAAQ